MTIQPPRWRCVVAGVSGLGVCQRPVGQRRDLSCPHRYWPNADWANLLSLHNAEVVTVGLVNRNVAVCTSFP